MSKFLKHFTGSIFRRKCLHGEHTPACFIIVIVGIKCYKCNLFDIHINDGLHKALRITSHTVEPMSRNNSVKCGQEALQGKQAIAIPKRQLGLPLQLLSY